jgi:hypothetical protein
MERKKGVDGEEELEGILVEMRGQVSFYLAVFW